MVVTLHTCVSYEHFFKVCLHKLANSLCSFKQAPLPFAPPLKNEVQFTMPSLSSRHPAVVPPFHKHLLVSFLHGPA